MTTIRLACCALGAIAIACGPSDDAVPDVSSPTDVAEVPPDAVPDVPAGDGPSDAAVPDAAPDLPAEVPGDASADTDVPCPQPVIVIDEGEEVLPGITLHLHGEQSVAGTGSITSWSWAIQQPQASVSALSPSAASSTPTHDVAVAGVYTYSLDVCDGSRCSNGPGCSTTARKTVNVCPCATGIHCELTWTTPGDPDPTDECPPDGWCGTDMDLHFLHPDATGQDIDCDGTSDGWFDGDYDAYSFNAHPQWDSTDPSVLDDPNLDRDDPDGAGPENVTLVQPANNRVYRVGVHYRDDHDFGASYPRVRCWIQGQLSFDRDLQALGVPMNDGDLWEAATIAWPQGVVAAVQNPDGSPRILSPDACPP